MKLLTTLKHTSKKIKETIKGEYTMMAALIALNIIEGIMTFSQIKNKRFREQVRKQLALMGQEDLAKE